MKKKRKKDSNIHLQNNPGYVIELKNVFKSYPISRNEVTPILKGVDLKIKRGEFVILFGKSGSGKSTLLNIMSGLDRANHGDVIVENTNLPYLSNEELTKFRRRHVAFIFQQYHLLNNITGYENVETGLILQKHKDRKNFNIKKAFEEFDLLDVVDKYPSQMSGGQQQIFCEFVFRYLFYSRIFQGHIGNLLFIKLAIVIISENGDKIQNL